MVDNMSFQQLIRHTAGEYDEWCQVPASLAFELCRLWLIDDGSQFDILNDLDLEERIANAVVQEDWVTAGKLYRTMHFSAAENKVSQEFENQRAWYRERDALPV